MLPLALQDLFPSLLPISHRRICDLRRDRPDFRQLLQKDVALSAVGTGPQLMKSVTPRGAHRSNSRVNALRIRKATLAPDTSATAQARHIAVGLFILKLDRLRRPRRCCVRDEFRLAATAQSLTKMAKLMPVGAPPLTT